jgi:hypothetical protein
MEKQKTSGKDLKQEAGKEVRKATFFCKNREARVYSNGVIAWN